MQVKNSLTAQKKSNAVEYKVGDDTIKLTPGIVKSYFVTGNPQAVTDQEVMMFISLCRYAHLNPWLHEAYCIKYGSQPATLVVGKVAFQKRAEANPNFDGIESGIVTYNKETKEVAKRDGTLKVPGEQIIGGWATVYRKDRTHPIHCEVSFDEYAAKKKDGTLNSMWSGKPAMMIRKVAVVNALRDAFPTSLEGLYTAEEQGMAEPEATTAEVVQQTEAAEVEKEVLFE